MRRAIIALMLVSLLILATTVTAFARDGAAHGNPGIGSNPLGTNDCAGAIAWAEHGQCGP